MKGATERAHKLVDAWNSRHSPGETVTLITTMITITTSIAYVHSGLSASIHVHGVKGRIPLTMIQGYDQ